MSPTKKIIFRVLSFIGIAGLVVMLYVKYRVAPDLDFSTLQLKTPEGQTVQLGSFKGKVVFVNFWQTWCGPCNDEMFSIDKAEQKLDTARFVFITVSDESPEKITAFRDRHDYHFLYLIAQKKFRELGINTYPTTYILDKNGRALFTKIGAADWSDPSMLERIQNMAR